ncbi:MAG: DUF932 domain-containing protein [Candidatus Bipolaricaulis sp.]|nr:DUF932 domain-containing protein [Candidatus Bipolaricaulis sp.]
MASIDEQNINLNSPAAPEKAVFSAQTSIGLGKPDETWAKHNLYQYPITFNGAPTRAKMIIRDRVKEDATSGTFNDVEELIAIAGQGYNLLPNEEVLDVANQAAKLAGFEPFFERLTKGDWSLGKVNGHVLCNNKETQMHALYIPKETNKHNWEETEVGKVVRVGVDVVNSIDGKKSFGIGLFSFRAACTNGVLFGGKQETAVHYAHTKSLSSVVEQLKTLFVQQMDNARLILENYQRLNREKLQKKDVELLQRVRLPEKILPAYVADEEQVKQEAFKDVTKWTAYNDITAQIWHNPKNDLTGKEFQFNQLHKAIPVTLRVR